MKELTMSKEAKNIESIRATTIIASLKADGYSSSITELSEGVEVPSLFSSTLTGYLESSMLCFGTENFTAI
jgi:hypothetical protein